MGVSIHTIRVSARIAAAPSLVGDSPDRVLHPLRARHLVEQAVRAAVGVGGTTTWSPGARRARSTASSPARPLAKAKPRSPPSRAACTPRAVRVRLADRSTRSPRAGPRCRPACTCSPGGSGDDRPRRRVRLLPGMDGTRGSRGARGHGPQRMPGMMRAGSRVGTDMLFGSRATSTLPTRDRHSLVASTGCSPSRPPTRCSARPSRGPGPTAPRCCTSRWAASGGRAHLLEAPRRRDHRRRLHGRLHAEPDLRGDLHGAHRARRGGARGLRPLGDVTRAPAQGVLGEPRPHAGQPAGQRRRHGIPSAIFWTTPGQGTAARATRSSFQDVLTRAGRGEITTTLASATRCRAVLVRRGLPPAVPPQEPERVLQPRAERAHLPRRRRQPPRADRHRPARLTRPGAGPVRAPVSPGRRSGPS